MFESFFHTSRPTQIAKSNAITFKSGRNSFLGYIMWVGNIMWFGSDMVAAFPRARPCRRDVRVDDEHDYSREDLIVG